MKIEDVNRLIKQAEKPLVKTYAGGKPNYCTPVDVVNISQECVDETTKGEHEWVGLTDDEKQFLKAMGLVGIDLVEAKLKEKNT